MASRRDELNAYTFAKRRTLASFLQPSASGSEEGAPRPLRAVLPGSIVGVVVLAVFGGIGMFSPTAPKGWDDPYKHVIVADKSTTRYVVMKTDGEVQLHPVLNMASAKLILEQGQGDVVTVDESVLDGGDAPKHGVTVGIPYAPDRLPSPQEAEAAKRWMVCERPTSGGTVQQATFVLGKDDRKIADDGDRLTGGELMYVVADDKQKTEYVVDAHGVKYPVSAGTPKEKQQLLRALDAVNRTPQKVSDQWLATLHEGTPVTFPTVDGQPGAVADTQGSLDSDANKVGTVLVTRGADQTRQYYVVLPDRIADITPFTAQLLISSPDLAQVNGSGQARQVAAGQIVTDGDFAGDNTWPTQAPKTVNATDTGGGRNVVCNTLRGVGSRNSTTLSTWAGKSFPKDLPTGSSSAYVTPGSGQLFRQVMGTDSKSGSLFLVTDTGLRYAMQSNSDGDATGKGIGLSDKQKKELLQQAQIAQTRLGYDKTTPAQVPAEWSKLLPTGPRLSEAAARTPQGS
ncbi:type VII secretion protein EccB [Streptomyces sp. SID5785]|uniref:type VII secretion protein EccB n=1 Tax=Streptomyces sp. SID5785 TaxID=2690309 RepID=UPI001360CB0C|nr:type VII secretion protein EccB [Streptomyces sp. SID5785]MZD10468.1 type VII secretion protein EccB [Streptomyces sp. SID5785]